MRRSLFYRYLGLIVIDRHWTESTQCSSELKINIANQCIDRLFENT